MNWNAQNTTGFEVVFTQVIEGCVDITEIQFSLLQIMWIILVLTSSLTGGVPSSRGYQLTAPHHHQPANEITTGFV